MDFCKMVLCWTPRIFDATLWWLQVDLDLHKEMYCTLSYYRSASTSFPLDMSWSWFGLKQGDFLGPQLLQTRFAKFQLDTSWNISWPFFGTHSLKGIQAKIVLYFFCFALFIPKRIHCLIIVFRKLTKRLCKMH